MSCCSSSFLGEPGPTARFLVNLGQRALHLIPRDLRNAILEVSGQAPQLAHMRQALRRLNVPVHVIHGDADDFAPIELAEQLAAEQLCRRPVNFIRVPGANHFLNDGPVEVMMSVLEQCIPAPAPPKPAFKLPTLPSLAWLTHKHVDGGHSPGEAVSA